MKTFKQFYVEAYQLNEFQLGNPLNNPLVKKVTQNPLVKGGVKLGTRALGALDVIDPKTRPGEKVVGALTAVRPFHPASMAASVAVPLALNMAQERRQAQQTRLNQLVAPQKGESGYYGSGKPAQIKPLRK